MLRGTEGSNIECEEEDEAEEVMARGTVLQPATSEGGSERDCATDVSEEAGFSVSSEAS
jgi:hypothetical protein